MITIIDDDEATGQSIQRLLRSHGMASQVFSSATDFLGSGCLNETHCLILDVRMPGMGGLQLRQHLVRAGLMIPTIYITGYIDDAVKQGVMQSSIVDVLEKPFDDKELIARIDAVTAGMSRTPNPPSVPPTI
jgi:FixJ family two-component response regulator